MSYGHADANLASISQLERETEELLRALDAADPDFADQLSEESWPLDLAVWETSSEDASAAH
jgi:hypothetical protein